MEGQGQKWTLQIAMLDDRTVCLPLFSAKAQRPLLLHPEAQGPHSSTLPKISFLYPMPQRHFPLYLKALTLPPLTVAGQRHRRYGFYWEGEERTEYPLKSWGTLDFLSKCLRGLERGWDWRMTVLRPEERTEVPGEGCKKM